MELKKAPFQLHGKFMGTFEAYVCPNCHRKFFTQKAFEEIMKIPIFPDDFSDFIEG